MLNDVRDRQQLLLLHKKAKKSGFDFMQYNLLKDQINKLEFDLKRLRDPLKLRVPPKPVPQTVAFASVPPTPTPVASVLSTPAAVVSSVKPKE